MVLPNLQDGAAGKWGPSRVNPDSFRAPAKSVMAQRGGDRAVSTSSRCLTDTYGLVDIWKLPLLEAGVLMAATLETFHAAGFHRRKRCGVVMMAATPETSEITVGGSQRRSQASTIHSHGRIIRLPARNSADAHGAGGELEAVCVKYRIRHPLRGARYFVTCMHAPKSLDAAPARCAETLELDPRTPLICGHVSSRPTVPCMKPWRMPDFILAVCMQLAVRLHVAQDRAILLLSAAAAPAAEASLLCPISGFCLLESSATPARSQMLASCSGRPAAAAAPTFTGRTFSAVPRTAAALAAARSRGAAIAALPQICGRGAAPAAWSQLLQHPGPVGLQQRRRSTIATAATAEAPEETFQYQAEVRGSH